MRDFAKVSPRFWTGKTGKAIRKLGDAELVIAMHLITCPNANGLGIYYMPLPTLAHETGRPIQGASKALRRVCGTGFCAYDTESEVVWVVNMAKHQIAESLKPGDKRVMWVAKEYAALPENPFLAGFFRKYESLFHMKDLRDSEEKGDVWGSPFDAPSMPHRSQETEQEQEQETEKEQEMDIIPTASRSETNKDIESIVAYYRQRHPGRGKHLKPGHKDWQRISARLADGHDAEDLCRAIDGNLLDKWHVEKSAHTIEMIFRNSSKVETFAALSRQGGPKLTGWLGATQEFVKEWIDEDNEAAISGRDDAAQGLLPAKSGGGCLEGDPF